VALSTCAEPGPPPIELDRECEFGGTPCVDGAYCYDTRCNNDRGTCVAMPDSCSAEPDPRCGCDGEVYENACAAAMAGVPIGYGDCTAPAGMFMCGDEFCAIDTEYCEVVVGGGQSDAWRCVSLECPAGSSGCECIDPEPCPKDDLFFSQTCFMPDGGGTGVECLRP
jgi:hypothetical protein